MKAVRSRRLYVRLFFVVGTTTLIFQILLTAFFANFFGAQYKAQALEVAKNLLNSTQMNVDETFQRLVTTAYGLIYCETTQTYLNLSAHASDYDVILAQEGMASLFFVTRIHDPDGVEYTVYSDGPWGGTYSTIEPVYIYDRSYDFSQEDWFRDFLSQPEQRRKFYPNVSMVRYARNQTEPVHVIAFRSNNVNTLVNNGYVFLQFSSKTFDELLSNLGDIASNVLILDENGNQLYESLNYLDADTLCAEATEDSEDIRTAQSGASYVPMYMTVNRLDWTIYCTMDATKLQADLAYIRAIFTFATAALLVCLLTVIYLTSRRVTRHLECMTEGIKHMMNGQFDIRLESSDNDEVSLLAQAFNDLTQQLSETKARVQEYKQLQQSMAFYALQQQVNPHFLFNTLDMIIGMATQGDMQPIISACSCLSSMFRYSLSRNLTVPLGQELAYIDNYLKMLSLRSRGRIQGAFLVPEEENGTMIPKLTLQPFVENSVKYGFDQQEQNCRVKISVARSRDLLIITIQDNGSGFPEKTLEQLSAAVKDPGSVEVTDRHIGILNVCRRLNLIYGKNFSMTLENLPEGGASVTLRFPPDFPNAVI